MSKMFQIPLALFFCSFRSAAPVKRWLEPEAKKLKWIETWDDEVKCVCEKRK